MGCATSKVVSVKNHNEPDVKEIEQEVADQEPLNSREVCVNSKTLGFLNFCRENSAKLCGEKNVEKFIRLSEQG